MVVARELPLRHVLRPEAGAAPRSGVPEYRRVQPIAVVVIVAAVVVVVGVVGVTSVVAAVAVRVEAGVLVVRAGVAGLADPVAVFRVVVCRARGVVRALVLVVADRVAIPVASIRRTDVSELGALGHEGDAPMGGGYLALGEGLEALAAIHHGPDAHVLE